MLRKMAVSTRIAIAGTAANRQLRVRQTTTAPMMRLAPMTTSVPPRYDDTSVIVFQVWLLARGLVFVYLNLGT